MICNNCGKELDDNLDICDNCGEELSPSKKEYSNEEMEKASIFSKTISKYDSKIKIENDDNEESFRTKKKQLITMSQVRTCLIVLLIILAAFLLYIGVKQIFKSRSGQRTIMIYMVGSDLESKYLAATKDIDEIIGSDVDFDDINILIYTGGTREWHKTNIPNDKQALFELNSDGLELIEEYDNNVNMLEYNNLSFLLNYGYENYKTDYYDLILWDHGAGPIYGYGYDEYNKLDSMNLDEIKKALEESPFNKDNKLELVGFDACLMSSIEVAALFSDYSNYMIASEEFEPGGGWDYSFLGKLDSSYNTEDFGRLVIDYYNDYYVKKKYIKGISLTLIKLNRVDIVEERINNLFKAIDKDLQIDFSSISRSRSNSKSFGRISNEEYYYDLVDLEDLLDRLPDKYKVQKEELRATLGDLIVYQKTDLEGTNGVSIYFPYENKNKIIDNLKYYKDLGFAKEYYNFISSFSSKLTGVSETNWDISKSTIESSENGTVSITFEDDVLNNYSYADYIIFKKDDNGYFTPIYNGSDLNVNGNVLSTTISNKSIVITDKNNVSMNLTAIESVKGIDFVKYYIPATLSRTDAETFEFDIIAVYLEFVIDEEHPNGFVAGYYPMEFNENHTYSKVEINPKDWSIITLLSYKYKILDEEDNYTSNWENNGEVLNMEVRTKDDYKIEIKELEPSNNYYCLFRIKDSYGKIHISNIVEVNI